MGVVPAVGLMQISEHDQLSCADPPSNRLADLSGANYNDDIYGYVVCHKLLFIAKVKPVDLFGNSARYFSSAT